MIGTALVMPSVIRRPLPESTSSGREYPVNPATSPRIMSTKPISQFSSRGFRKAPVKKIRIMWVTIAAMNSSAAQWWICRMRRPPRTSNERWSVDAKASDI